MTTPAMTTPTEVRSPHPTQRSLVQIQLPQPTEVQTRRGVGGYHPLTSFVRLCTKAPKSIHLPDDAVRAPTTGTMVSSTGNRLM